MKRREVAAKQRQCAGHDATPNRSGCRFKFKATRPPLGDAQRLLCLRVLLLRPGLAPPDARLFMRMIAAASRVSAFWRLSTKSTAAGAVPQHAAVDTACLCSACLSSLVMQNRVQTRVGGRTYEMHERFVDWN